MNIDSKKILTIGAGAVVGYLLFCKFMKKGAEKSLEEGAPSEEGGSGGGGGGFGGGGIGGGGSLPPVVAPIVPSGYVVIGNSITPRENLLVNNPYSSIPVSNVQPTRETPPTPPTPPQPTDISGAPVMSASTNVKFADFDGDANFQDALL